MIHVVFSASASGTLRQLFHARGIRQDIVATFQLLDWGPIASDDLADRERWFDRHVPSDVGGWNWFSESAAEFRTRVAADKDRLLWICLGAPDEQAELYWYLDTFGGEGAKMIVADFPLRTAWQGETPSALGQLDLGPMAELFDKCPRVPWDASRFPADRWRNLMAEDALLRIVEDGVLRSAKEDLFDEYLLRRCSAAWNRYMRVIGYAMADLSEAGHRACDTFLLWRLRNLIECGMLACDGELPRHGASSRDGPKVRLPT